MDLREHLRDNLRAAMPAHIEVRCGPSATDTRRLLMFTDGTPTEPDAASKWFCQCTGTVVAPSGSGEGFDVVAYAGARSLDVAPDALEAALGGDEGARGAEWYPYVEGVRMLVYRWEGEWRLSTARVVDARSGSYFRGSPSFGAQFDAAALRVGLDVAALDPGRCYVFIVQTEDTPMVASSAGHDLLHVATYDVASLAPVDAEVGVPRPAWRPVGADWGDVRAALDGPLTAERLGVIVRNRDRDWHAKVMHPDYASARDLVGGDRDLERRLLEIATTPELKRQLLELMPGKRSAVMAVDAAVDEATARVMNLYIEFNVRHRRSTQPQPVYETLKALQKAYLARPKPRPRMVFGDVDAFVRRLPTPALASLVRACHPAPAEMVDAQT